MPPAAKKAKTTLTPWQKQEAALEQQFSKDKALIGQLLIRAVDDAEEDTDPNTLSAQDVSKLRYILINQQRADCLDEMRRLVLGQQADDDMLFFNTSFSYQVLGSFQKRFLRLYSKKSKKQQQFNYLFAYTYTLMEYDTWVTDHEPSPAMDAFVAKLGSMWKDLLPSSNATLGIDAAFTRPGTVALVEDFSSIGATG